MKDKLVGANRLNELVEHYVKLYENEKHDKTSDRNHCPIKMNKCGTITMHSKGREGQQRVSV